MPRPSGTWAQPIRAIRKGAIPVTSFPSSRTEPPVADSRPVATRATVDLPAPLEPIRAVIPAEGTEKVTSNSAR
jgi:hypothetical protein